MNWPELSALYTWERLRFASILYLRAHSCRVAHVSLSSAFDEQNIFEEVLISYEADSFAAFPQAREHFEPYGFMPSTPNSQLSSL